MGCQSTILVSAARDRFIATLGPRALGSVRCYRILGGSKARGFTSLGLKVEGDHLESLCLCSSTHVYVDLDISISRRFENNCAIRPKCFEKDAISQRRKILKKVLHKKFMAAGAGGTYWASLQTFPNSTLWGLLSSHSLWQMGDNQKY